MTKLDRDHLDLVYDCTTGKQVDYVDTVDAAKKQYHTGHVEHGKVVLTRHDARNVLVVDRVAYLNTKPGHPLPNVKHLLPKRVKKWP